MSTRQTMPRPSQSVTPSPSRLLGEKEEGVGGHADDDADDDDYYDDRRLLSVARGLGAHQREGSVLCLALL